MQDDMKKEQSSVAELETSSKFGDAAVTKERPIPKPSGKRREYKSAKAKAKSETVADLKSATDAILTLQQAINLPVPAIGDGIEAARNYINQVHVVIEKTEGALTELVARTGTILLAYRNSEHGVHGNWGPFLKKHFPISERTARNYMSVALETTPEQRAGKRLTEIYQEIGVVTKPGEVVKTRFLAVLEAVEKRASAIVESVYKVAESFDSAVSPYNGSNRDIGAMIHEYANQIATQMTQCQKAAALVINAVRSIADVNSPERASFHAEGLGKVRKHSDWSDYPTGTSVDGKQFEQMTCCEKETAMTAAGKSTGTCRECGKKVAK